METQKMLNNVEGIVESLIEVHNSTSKSSLFRINIDKLSKLCLKSDVSTIENEKEINILKYVAIIIIPLTCFAKDDTNIQFNHAKVKDLVSQLILTISKTLKLTNPKLKTFFKQILVASESIVKLSKNFVKVIFGNKNEYKTLKTCVNQFILNTSNLDLQTLIGYINDIVLFANDAKEKEKININPPDDDGPLIPTAPYIKEPLSKKFCLVLDLDETLSHTVTLPFGTYFLLRPSAVKFLEKVSSIYEIVIFTSSPKSYADSILNKIDIDKNLISHRLYRKHTQFIDNKTVKDLSRIGRDLKKTILVDNVKDNARFQKDNLILIKSWYSDIFDTELEKLGNKLVSIGKDPRFENDIRKGIH